MGQQARLPGKRACGAGAPTEQLENISLSIEPKPRFDLFISFSSKDRHQPWFGRSVDLVTELKTALEQYYHPISRRRFRVCTYEEDFELAGAVRAAITVAIEQSRSLLFVSGEGARTSDFVRFELEYATTNVPGKQVLTALVDLHPSDAFPTLFASDTQATDLSIHGCSNLASWRRRLEMEAAKLAARVWDVSLQQVRDRFLIEQRRRRLWTIGGSAAAVLAVSIAAMIGISQYRGREAARVLGVHQRYAADMATVQRAWTAGDVAGVKSLLRSFVEHPRSPDPRTFEWYSFWRVANAERFALGKLGNPIKSTAASPGKPWVAFASDDSAVTVVDIVKGNVVATLSARSTGSDSVAFASNGSLLALVNGGLLIWDPDLRTETLVTGDANRPFIALACTFSVDLCVLVDNAGSTYVRSENKLRAVRSNAFRIAGGFRFVISESGKYLVGVNNGTIQVLNARTHNPSFKKEGLELRADLDIGVQGDTVVIPEGAGVILLDLASRELKRSPRLVNGRFVSAAAADRDGRLFAIADPTNQSIGLWQVKGSGDAIKWKKIGSMKGYRGWVRTIHIIPQQKLLVASSLGGDFKVWDLTRIGRRVVQASDEDVREVTFAPSGGDFISLSKGGAVRRWSTLTMRVCWEVSVGEYSWSAVAPFGVNVAVAEEGVIHVFDKVTGKLVSSFPGWPPLARSSDALTFAYVDPSGTRVLVKYSGGQDEVSFAVQPEASGELDIVSLALASDGTSLLVGTGDGRLMRFGSKSRTPVYEIKAHAGLTRAIAISPDGQYVATASSDQTVRLWNVSTGDPVAVLRGHRGAVQTVAFSPDGATLASGDQAGVIKLWNVPSRMETIAFYAHQEDLHPGVTTLAFDRDGSRLVSGGARGTIIVWEADPPRTYGAPLDGDLDKLSQARRACE